MNQFFEITLSVILPIFLVMSFGYLITKVVTLDLGSLSKLNFYVFIPVFMFYSLLIFKPGNREISMTIIFNLLLACLSFAVMYGLTRWMRFSPNLAAASTLGVMIFNSANYGIPVINLFLFGDEHVQGEGVAIQVITITTMNIITYTLGVLLMGGWSEWKKGIQTILKLPIIYALIAALLLRGFDVMLPDPLMTSLKWTADGMMSIALLTLGAQLGQAGISLRHPKELWITISARLLAGPLLAFALLKLFILMHLMEPGLLAKVLFISSSFPTAVATVLFGIEYDKEPTFAADVVFITTLLSAVTVSLAIKLAPTFF